MTRMPRSLTRQGRRRSQARRLVTVIAALGLAAAASLPVLAEDMTETEATAAPATPPSPATETAAPEQPVAGQAIEGVAVAPVMRPKVAMARFTTAVENREPVDSVAFLSTAASQIFFYTDLRDLSGETVTHRWEHAGKVVAEVAFDVKGPRWRVWSSKQLLPDLVGDWTVSVVNGDGEVLAAESFTYSQIDTGA